MMMITIIDDNILQGFIFDYKVKELSRCVFLAISTIWIYKECLANGFLKFKQTCQDNVLNMLGFKFE